MAPFRRRALAVAVGAVTALTGSVLATTPAEAALPPGAQPVPGHTTLVPSKPRTNTPRISTGEIWDMEVVGSKAYVAGSFPSLTNRTGTQTTVNQALIAAFNLDTGLIDTTFRPVIGGGGVTAVEASPDGTKLYIGGNFKTINGVSKRNVASISPTTGAAVAGFTASASSQVDSLAATNSTLYIGGRFSTINGTTRVGLAAVNGGTGAVDLAFDNQISGGIGVDGTLSVRQLKLTHDNTKLLVVHSGRRINNQDRYGVGIIDTATRALLPWRTRLWEDNLPFVGGIQRLYAGDISPDDSYFVVSSADGGDRPPISDTAIAFSIDGADNMAPRWVARNFDSVYSIAITEKAVYIGGHFNWNESPQAPDPWPGLDNVGYGTGQGLSGYGLGDAVVRRDQVGALNPADGKALEWNPGSSAFEGVKAMEATSRGLLVGGDGMIHGGVRTGRVAFYDLAQLPAATSVDTTITAPIEGRVVTAGQQFTFTGTATAPGPLRRVQVVIQDRDTSAFLQDDLVTWSRSSNNIYATLGTPSAGVTPWSLPVTFAGSHDLQVKAKAYGPGSTVDPVEATKKFESFSFDDQTPATGVSGPGGTVLNTTTFVVTGTASDDHGVNALSVWIRDANLNYLQDDGTTAPNFTTFRIEPDVIGATNATWQWEVTVPYEGVWRVSASAIDTAGQTDLRGAVREWTVVATGVAPTMTMTAPVVNTPPTTALPITVAPGSPMTFSGTATDDVELKSVEITLRNATTLETLAADGTWGTDVISGFHRISPLNFSGTTYNWSYTTPFNLSPGIYTFSARATDNLDLTTSTTNQTRLTVNVVVPGDAAPNGLLNFTGTDMSLEVLHLDLAGTATDDVGVAQTLVTVQDSETRRYVQSDGTMAAHVAFLPATLATPGATSTTWTLPVNLPAAGNFGVTAYAVDTAGQRDTSTVGATARYLVFPGDLDPYLSPTLNQPIEGSAFTESRIFASGRAFDDIAMGRVDVGIINSLGYYMSSTGTFSAGERYVSAFLTSPGTPGSQYSYQSPLLPAGAYKVRVRPVDNHGQYPLVLQEVNVTVTAPASNLPPVAHATVACVDNVCTFDGRTSTDENASTLTYAWNFGNTRTGTGSVPKTTYFGPGTFTVTLTVRDEFGATAITTMAPLTIVEPVGNVAPTAVISPPNCALLVCNFSGLGSTDSNVGDVISYLWDFGDGTATSTLSAPNHVFLLAGTYTVTLTTRDGWGKTATATTTVTVG